MTGTDEGPEKSVGPTDAPSSADDERDGGGRPPIVALDTSALMAPVEADVRLFEELDRLLGAYETVVPASVRSELAGLSSGGGTAATAASVGSDLATRARTVEVGGTGDDDANGGSDGDTDADDALVALARTGRVGYVVTNDRPLVERVLDADTPVICLRGRNTLAITEP